MSADHRKPVAAFVVLVFLAAAIVTIQRADALGGRFVASVLGIGQHVQGVLPRHTEAVGVPEGSSDPRGAMVTGLGRTARADRDEPARASVDRRAARQRDEGRAERGPAAEGARRVGTRGPEAAHAASREVAGRLHAALRRTAAAGRRAGELLAGEASPGDLRREATRGLPEPADPVRESTPLRKVEEPVKDLVGVATRTLSR